MKSKNNENKTILEIVLMPLVVALIGIIGTYLITSSELKSSENIANAQIESSENIANAQIESSEKKSKAEQQLKILEIFGDKITSNNIKERLLAVRLLGSVDPELSGKLAKAISQDENEDKQVREDAKDVAKNSVSLEINNLINKFSGNERLIASNRLIELYDKNQKKVIEALIEGILPEDNKWSYRVNLYIVLTLSQIKPKWIGTNEQKEIIVALKNTRNYKDSTFKKRVDEAIKNYQMITN